MTNLSRRVSKLEMRKPMNQPPRIVVRYEGAGSEAFPQPEEETDENTTVIVLRYVDEPLLPGQMYADIRR
jgi:hypothetical protein